MSIVTSSALDRWQCPNLETEPVVAVTRQLRDKARQLVLTGFHGTVEPKAMLEATGVDAVLLGEPEETVGDLGAGMRLDETPGLAFLREGVKNTPVNPVRRSVRLGWFW